MVQPTQPTDKEQQKPVMRTWYMELILGSVALAVVYLAGSLALDTGSLVAYAIVIIFLVMSVRHFYNAAQAFKKGRKHDREQ